MNTQTENTSDMLVPTQVVMVGVVGPDALAHLLRSLSG